MSIIRVSATEIDQFIPQVFGNSSFSSFSLSAFHDLRDDPKRMKMNWGTHLGRFNEFNAEIANHAQLNPLTKFVMENEWYRKFKDDIITFAAEDQHWARLYAYNLRTYGRWAHAWNNPHNWPEYDRRGKPLQVRLVRKRMVCIVEEYPI